MFSKSSSSREKSTHEDGIFGEGLNSLLGHLLVAMKTS